MGNGSLELLGTGMTFLTLTLLTFGLRVYVRGFILRKWGPDDWLISCSTFFFVTYIACQTAGIVYGTGKHLKDLEPERAKKALVFWWLCELFYIPSAVFLKLSVGVFLHRITINRCHIWIVRFMMFCSGVFGSAYLLLAIFQCKPINAWWERKHSPLSRDYGWCFDNNIVVATTFASSGLNSIADWTFGLIPIFIVKDLQMPKKQKMLVAGILGFANIACIATIVRMPFIMTLYKDDDFLFETTDIALWSNVEPGIGITAACIATLRPLLQKLVGDRLTGWFSGGHLAPVNYYGSGGKPSGSGQSYVLRTSIPNLRPDRVGNYTEITAGTYRRPSTKDPMITGREMRDLYEASDLNEDDYPEQEVHLNSAAEEPGRTSPPRATLQLERKTTLEIQKRVEITFTEEIKGDHADSRSPTPIGPPMATLSTDSDSRAPWENDIPALDTSILASLSDRNRSNSRQSTR